MAGNRALYETALKRGHDYAWQNQWDRALKEYQRAVGEFPDDRDARSNLALAYLRLKQWPDALREYLALAQDKPKDTFIQSRLADIYVATNDTSAAERTYFGLADLFEQQNQPSEAVKALQELTRVLPRNERAYKRIGDLAEHIGDQATAAQAHIMLANLATESNNLDGALAQADYAFNLTGSDEARDLLYKLRRIQNANAPAPPPKKQEGLGQGEINEMLTLAVGYQERKQYAAATRMYEALVNAGVRRPDVIFNLGLLNQQTGQHQVAIQHFQGLSQDEDYAMSAFYSMGESYRALGNLTQAAQSYDSALRLINLQTIGKGEIDDLIQLYESAAQTYIAMDNTSRAATLYSSLAGFLQGRHWNREQTEEIQHKAKSLTEESMRAKLRRISGDESVSAEADATRTQPPEVISGRLSSTTLRPITDYLKATPAQPDPEESAPYSGPRRVGQSESLRRVGQSEPVRHQRQSEPMPRPAPPPPANPNTNTIRLADQPTTPTAPPAAARAVRSLRQQQRDTQNLSFAVNQMLREMRTQMDNALYYAAVDNAFEVIRVAPDYLPVHLHLAQIYQRQGRPEESLVKYQTTLDLYLARNEPAAAADIFPLILELDPNNVTTRSRFIMSLTDLKRLDDAALQELELAAIYQAQGQDERATDEYRRARQLAPANANVRLTYADFLAERERYPEALVELRHVLEIDANNAPAMLLLNTILTILNEDARWDSLSEVLRHAQENPGFATTAIATYTDQAHAHALPDFYYALAMVERTAGREADAIQHLNAGIKLLPPHGSGLIAALMYNALGEMHIARADGKEAVRALEETRQLLEGDTDLTTPRPQYTFARPPARTLVYHALAEAYSMSDDPATAIAYLQELKRMLPYDRDVYTRLADLYFRQGQLPQALTALDELAEHYKASFQTDKMIETLIQMTILAPSNISIRTSLSDIYLKRGLIDQGLAELDTLADLQQKNGMLKDAVRSLQQAAEIYWMMGRHKQAFDVYDRITRIASSDVEARQQLTNLYIQVGQMADAVKEQKTIAKICLQAGQLKEAEAALHQVIALAPDDTEAYYALGRLLAVMSEFGQAAKLYSRLARLNPGDPKVQIMQADMQRRAEDKKAASSNEAPPSLPPAPLIPPAETSALVAAIDDGGQSLATDRETGAAALTAPSPISAADTLATDEAAAAPLVVRAGTAPLNGTDTLAEAGNGAGPALPQAGVATFVANANGNGASAMAEAVALPTLVAAAPPLPLDGGVPDDSGMAALPGARPNNGQAGG